MALSMYEASIPVLVRFLKHFSAMLDKAEEYAKEQKIDPVVLANARLAPDMYPLINQVQLASDAAKGCAARLAGMEVPSFADTEKSFAELQKRIARTLDFIKGIPSERFEGSEDRPITVRLPKRELSFTGRDYLLYFVQPNLYFHVVTAYAILRHQGVGLGKMDFLGSPDSLTAANRI
jgi:hypothetical protein